MNTPSIRQRFRTALQGPRCVYCPSVFDPLSARIAESLGFEMGILGGSIASLAVTGAPDTNVLTLSEFAEQAQRICRASALPLIADADNGYGNALNVMRTVQELERAGCAAITIEDTRIPRAYGGAASDLIAIEEAVGKLGAALAARVDPDLALIARTHAGGGAGRDADVQARLAAYAATGVDALCVVGVRDRAQLGAIVEASSLPLLFISYAGEDLGSLRDLDAQRVRIWVDGHAPYLAAVQATYAALTYLRERQDANPPPALAPAALMAQLTRRTAYDAWTRDFLRAG